MRTPRVLTLSAVLVALVCASSCVSSSPAPPAGQAADGSVDGTTGPDAAVAPEAGPDAPVVDAEAGVSADDAGNDASPSTAPDAATDATADAQTDAGPPVVLLTAVNGANTPVGARYVAGAWSTLSTLGSDIFAPGGGGVTVLPDGGGAVVLRGNANTSFESGSWTGTWSTLAVQGSGGVSYVGAPIATATGAAAAHQTGVNTYDDLFDELSGATWTYGEATTSVGDNQVSPVVVLTSAGDPLLLTATSSSTYTWSLRTSGAWSAATAINGLTPPIGPDSLEPMVVAATVVGANEIVAVFSTSAPALEASTFSAGAWTSPVSLATDLPSSAFYASCSLAALPDGTVSMAYVATGGAVNVGVLSAGTWSAFTAVPSVTASTETESPAISLARGGAGAQLELAYIDASSHLEHTRLVSGAWTTPTVIDASTTYGRVSIAVGP